MTVTEKAALVNQKGYLRIEDLKVGIRIVDVKTAYGNLRYLVIPLNGMGVKWVDANRVTLSDPSMKGESSDLS